VLEGARQNIRALSKTPANKAQANLFDIPEIEFGPDPIDVLIPPTGGEHGPRFRFHEQTAPLPPHALYPLRDGIHVVSPEVCLVQACASKSLVECLQIGMEFCGTYALRPDEEEGMAKRSYVLMDAAAFLRHVTAWNALTGLKQARVVAKYLVNGSASPMETVLYLLLCLPQKYGGYNIARPELNPELELTYQGKEVLRQQKVKPDMLWRKAKLVVEYDGKHHEDEAQRVKDEMRKVVLETMGYTVMQVKRHQVYNPLAFDNVATAIAKKLGKRVRPLTVKQSFARDRLREELLAADWL